MKRFIPGFRIALVASTLFTLAGFTKTNAQVHGCKDPLANNYNPSATINDGSCTYNTTFYTPPVKVDPISNVLVETSGLQMANNYLWSFNDGGGLAAIYRMDTVTNAILQTVTLAGATNIDWEDIAFDGTYFYIGDFGNNANGARTDLKIYKFPISAIADYTTNATVEIPSTLIEVIDFSYRDQTQPPTAVAANSTPFDCEAMLIDNNQIHLFSKNWVDLNTTHYVLVPTNNNKWIAEPKETLATNYLVTAADKAVGQNVVALLGYQNFGTGSHFMHLLSDYKDSLFFNGNKRRIDLPDATQMGQAEGITFRNGTYGYISNERFVRSVGSFTITVNQKLRSFNTASFVSPSVLANDLKSFNVSNNQGSQKLAWSFATTVNDLKIQYSNNGRTFTDLKTIGSSMEGAFANNILSASNCYRLTWNNNDASIKYSNIVCANNIATNEIEKLVLKANGNFSFFLNATTPQAYSFALIDVDGKILAESVSKLYNSGYNSIKFVNSNLRSGSVYLVSKSNNKKSSILLQISN